MTKIDGELPKGIPQVPLITNTFEFIDESSREPMDTSLEMSKIGDLNELSRPQINHFRYMHLCEMWLSDRENHDVDLNWSPLRIIKHHMNRKDKNDQHVVLKIAWLNGEMSLQRLDAFALAHPDMVVQYAKDHNLESSKYFRWTKVYDNLDRKDTALLSNHDNVVKSAVMASRFQGSPIMKFGVEVPQSV